MPSLAMILVLAQVGNLPLWSPGKQAQANCRPWEFQVDPPKAEQEALESFFTYQEPLPVDIRCPTEAPCLIARPEVRRSFSWDRGKYLGFELVLANPTTGPVRLVFPQVLPIVREAFTDRWRSAEAQPCWPWCGNANSSVDLKPGYCFRFAVPVYAGNLQLKQRFRGVLLGGTLMGDKRTELISNEFESSLSPEQLVPVNYCETVAELIDTTRPANRPAEACLGPLPVGRSLADFSSRRRSP